MYLPSLYLNLATSNEFEFRLISLRITGQNKYVHKSKNSHNSCSYFEPYGKISAWSVCHHRAVLRAAAFPLDRQDQSLGTPSSCGGGLVGLGSATPEQARTTAAHTPIQWMPQLGRLRQQGRSQLAAAYAPPLRAAAAHLDLHQAPRLARMALPGAADWGSSQPGPAAMDVDTAGSRIFCPPGQSTHYSA